MEFAANPETERYVRTLDWIQEQYKTENFHSADIGDRILLEPREEEVYLFPQKKIIFAKQCLYYFIGSPNVTRYNEVVNNVFLIKYIINDHPSYRLLEPPHFQNEFV